MRTIHGFIFDETFFEIDFNPSVEILFESYCQKSPNKNVTLIQNMGFGKLQTIKTQMKHVIPIYDKSDYPEFFI